MSKTPTEAVVQESLLRYTLPDEIVSQLKSDTNSKMFYIRCFLELLTLFARVQVT